MLDLDQQDAYDVDQEDGVRLSVCVHVHDPLCVHGSNWLAIVGHVCTWNCMLIRHDTFVMQQRGIGKEERRGLQQCLSFIPFATHTHTRKHSVCH